MTVQLDGDRSSTSSCRIFEPPRFFEALLRGRSFLEAPGHHRPHLRHLPGRVPDERGQRDGERSAASRCPSRSAMLRRLLYCGEWIESHALHVYMLHAPDFLGYDERRSSSPASTRARSSGDSR